MKKTTKNPSQQLKQRTAKCTHRDLWLDGRELQEFQSLSTQQLSAFLQKDKEKNKFRMVAIRSTTWEKSSLCWRIKNYNQPTNVKILVYTNWTSQVTEEMSNRCALHTAVNNSEENTKMLSQVKLPVPVSHKPIWFCNCRIQILEHLLGDFGGLWKIFFFNFWKRNGFFTYWEYSALKIPSYNLNISFNPHFLWRSFVLIRQNLSYRIGK